jgi:GT2 family glycosyltransferase/glycosyltransferase involved in cell wall biosynthesis
MKVSFIIPLYNGLALTQAMLASLAETLPAGIAHEIILVDDGSKDDTRDWLAGLKPPYRVLLNEKNLGFAGTCNRGAAAASGEYLFFLNNDLVLLAHWLEPMIAALQQGRRVGIVGNVQLNATTGEVDHTGIEVSEGAKLVHSHARPGPLRRMLGLARSPAAVTAACCLLRREVFLREGGFNDAFHNGGEDVDLCFRLQQRGYQVVVAYDSVVRHHIRAARGPTGLADEANSRLLFARWRKVILTAGCKTWAREVSRQFLSGSSPVNLSTSLAALAHHSGLSSTPPAAATLAVGSALFYEELHWQQRLEGRLNSPSYPVSAYELNGVYRDRRGVELNPDTVWMRDRAVLRLPAGTPCRNFFVNGFVLPEAADQPEAQGPLGLRITINGTQHVDFFPLATDHFNCGIDRPLVSAEQVTEIEITLLGVNHANTLAWLGRVAAEWPLPRRWRERWASYRPQRLNHRLRLSQIVGDDEPIYDFKHATPLRLARRWRTPPGGVNLIGWFRATLGVGESARCMARACDAAGLPTALINLRANCLNSALVDTFDGRLQDANPHPVNIFHLDPPQSEEIDHHHGPDFRKDKYNIAYWAWELPEFPDLWVKQCAHFDEIWCPSAFVRDAIAAKVPLPVHVMPHAIELPPPATDGRQRFQLPTDRFLFLFAYDLNSYHERKNPLAVIAAYRQAFPDERGVGLVIKTQNPKRNPEAYASLCTAIAGLSHAHIIAEALPVGEVHALQAACDAFVSLHRAEGFGLSVAECMYLGKPVISTDWSATAEFVNMRNGCPVKCRPVALTESHGPYEKGQIWAEPDVEQAAWWMRRLVTEPALAQELGRTAAADMRERFSPAVIGARYRRRLDAFSLWPE